MSNIAGDRETVFIVMSCLHTALFVKPSPRVGEYAFCYKCNAYKRAVIRPNAYRLECRDCTKLRDKDFGGRTLMAELAADKHARRFRGHRVLIYNGSDLHDERMHLPEPTLLDAPPY